MSSLDPYDLQRFMIAQAPIYENVVGELRSGRKTGHWMWFIFPQIAGLGLSALSVQFAIHSKREACAYLNHKVLGPRLQDCSQLLLSHAGQDIEQIMGSPDHLKLRSCMTLFASISQPESIFHQVIESFYGGKQDDATLAILTL